MIWEWQGIRHVDCVVFYRVQDEFGGLSNMSNEFPLVVNGIAVPSSEALYQACRFPNQPDWQREILDAPHAMQAKMKSRKERRRHSTRPDWADVQLDIMRWVLLVKLAQHPARIGSLLQTSDRAPIVEQSHRDRFWGAVADECRVLRGENNLGRLWSELRSEWLARLTATDGRLAWQILPPRIDDFHLLGRAVEPIVMADSACPVSR